MAYPLPTHESLNVTEGLHTIFIYANSVTEGGILFNLLLVAIHFIITMAIINQTKKDYPMAFVVGGFVTFIIALLMRLGGLITQLPLTMFLVLLIIEFLALLFTRD